MLDKLAMLLTRGEWRKVLSLMHGVVRNTFARAARADAADAAAAAASPAAAAAAASAPSGGVGGRMSSALLEEWQRLSTELARLQRQLDRPREEGVAFTFVEGSLVRALREGQWILLDEMNLAAAETLERVAAVLEEGGSIALTERGEVDVVPRHPNFRLFGAMNPPTDFGKKELPAGIRSRFTELYVEAIT